VPGGSVALVTVKGCATGGVTVRTNAADVDNPPEVTLTVTANVPEFCGVPVIAPPVEMESPEGRPDAVKL